MTDVYLVLEKARKGSMKPAHKYTSRELVDGEWQYTYPEDGPSVGLRMGVNGAIYHYASMPDSELQVVRRADGVRSVASFHLPEAERGKGLGQRLFLRALEDGPIAIESTSGVSPAYRRLQRALVQSGRAEQITDRDGQTLLRLIERPHAQQSFLDGPPPEPDAQAEIDLFPPRHMKPKKRATPLPDEERPKPVFGDVGSKFGLIRRSGPEAWTQANLETCTQDQLKILCKFMGIAPSGTKERLIKRLRDAIYMRKLLADVPNDPANGTFPANGVAYLTEKYKGKELLDMVRRIGGVVLSSKPALATQLIQWRMTSRQNGAKFNEEWKAAVTERNATRAEAVGTDLFNLPEPAIMPIPDPVPVLAPEPAPANPFQADIDRLQAQIDALTPQIDKLNGVIGKPDPMADYWKYGKPGGSGNRHNINRLNSKREASLDRTIDASVKMVPLFKLRESLQRQLDDIASGKRAAREAAKATREARVHGAHVGDIVLDGVYGQATVVRVNQKTLTIETPSGYREARPYNLISDVIPRAEWERLKAAKEQENA